MSFLTNMVEEFVEERMGGSSSNQQQRSGESYYNERPQEYYPQQGGYGGGGSGPQPPEPPYPWIAEWDPPAGRWIFINRETGYRTFEYPGPQVPSQQAGNYGYGGEGYGSGYAYESGGPGYAQRGEYYEEQRPVEVVEEKSHTGRNVAIGAAAGLVGGALLMHEGEKVEDKWDEDKYRFEQGVEDIPEDAARWTGEAVQDVEDIPEDAARWTGEEVGGVERFGDEIEGSYEEGRIEERYDDDGY